MTRIAEDGWSYPKRAALLLVLATGLGGGGGGAAEAAGIEGIWKAELACDTGVPMAAELALAQDAGGGVQARFGYAVASDPTDKGAYILKGTFDAAQGELALEPEDWLVKAERRGKLSNRMKGKDRLWARYVQDADTLLLTVDNRGCRFSAARRGGARIIAAEAQALLKGRTVRPGPEQPRRTGVVGAWSGFHVCGVTQRDLIDLVVAAEDGNAVRALLVSKNLRKPDKPGSLSLHGRFTAASGELELVPEKSLVEGRIRPFWNTPTLTFKLDPASGTLIPKNPPACQLPAFVAVATSPLEPTGAALLAELRDTGPSQAKAPPAPLPPVAPPAAGEADRGGIEGLWAGQYRCANNQKFQGEITILQKSSLELEAVFAFRGQAGTYGTGQFVMKGGIEAHTGEFTLKGVRWLARPNNFKMLDINGEYRRSGSRDSVTVRFADESCFSPEFAREESPALFGQAWAVLGQPDRAGTLQLRGKQIPTLSSYGVLLAGKVTEDAIYVDLKRSRYLTALQEQCMLAYGGGPEASLAKQQAAKPKCSRYAAAEYVEVANVARPRVIPASPNDDPALLPARTALPTGEMLGDQVVRYRIEERSRGSCFVFAEAHGAGVDQEIELLAVREGGTRLEPLAVKLVPGLDKVREQSLLAEIRDLKAAIETTRATIARTERSIPVSTAWDGGRCVPPVGAPRLPDRPELPDTEEIWFNAKAFCYEVMRRRMNPVVAEEGMRAAFLDDVIEAHEAWTADRSRRLACANQPPEQLGDILSQLFTGTILSPVVVGERYKVCYQQMVENCIAPLTAWRAEVQAAEQRHVEPYNTCLVDQRLQEQAKQGLPDLQERLRRAEAAMATFRAEYEARPKELTLPAATCR